MTRFLVVFERLDRRNRHESARKWRTGKDSESPARGQRGGDARRESSGIDVTFECQGRTWNPAAVGPNDEVTLDNERVDNVGKLAFTFDAGELDLTSKVPENEPFSVRATALDFNGVGKVSDVYVVLEYPTAPRDGEDLRSH